MEIDFGRTASDYARYRAGFPDRFFEMCISEANMIGVSAGLSFTGRLPFLYADLGTGRLTDRPR